MTLNDFRARLKGGNVGGWYIFAGEEDYLKRHYRGELSRAFDELVEIMLNNI